MQKLLLALLLVAPLVMAAGDKFLDYRFNENVIIRISNVSCPIKGMDVKKWPWAAMAQRSDGQVLFGCYNHNGDDIIIQWAMGDQSKFPANYFLAEKIEPNS